MLNDIWRWFQLFDFVCHVSWYIQSVWLYSDTELVSLTCEKLQFFKFKITSTMFWRVTTFFSHVQCARMVSAKKHPSCRIILEQIAILLIIWWQRSRAEKIFAHFSSRKGFLQSYTDHDGTWMLFFIVRSLQLLLSSTHCLRPWRRALPLPRESQNTHPS